jgi:hypothetical protein
MVCLMSGAALPEWGADGAIGEESGGRSRISGKGEASAPTGSAHPADDSGVNRPAGNISRSVLREGGAAPIRAAGHRRKSDHAMSQSGRTGRVGPHTRGNGYEEQTLEEAEVVARPARAASSIRDKQSM